MSDMSCHQVVSSKNSDDPYIFRDTPVTTSVYSSQLGRLTPIRLNQLNQQVLPKYSQNNPQQQLQQQQVSPRINGNLSLVNGFHNNQITTTTATTISSPLPKTHQQLHKFLTKHKSLPLPSSPTSSSATHSCSSPSSLVTTTTTTLTQHQPLVTTTNHQINQNNFLQQYQQLHQQQIINQPEQLQQQQVSISKLPPPLYHNSHNTLINHSTGGGGNGGLSGGGGGGGGCGSGGVTRIIIGQQQSQQQQQQHHQQTQKLPHHPISPLRRINSFTDRTTDKQSVNNSTPGILLGSSIPPPGVAILGGKSIKNENPHSGVLLPIKLENDLSRVSAASFSIPKTIGIGKKSLPSVVVTQTAAQSPVLPLYNRSIKRSSSQASSSHHTNNDHPRISSRLSNLLTLHHTPPSNEWHSPGAYIFDYMGPGATKLETLELAGCIQTHWFSEYFGEDEIINREQKLEIKKSILRRQAIQYLRSQKLRTNIGAKRRLLYVSKALNKLKIKEEPPQPQRCCISNCSNDALALTAYCHLHITHNTDQMLFHPCTAKFSDNSPCRVPVFDISHELPLCREHAWKRDNYDRMIQEQKPKKPPRKKPKPSAMTRPPKRNKKKKKPPAIVQQAITHQIHQPVHQNQQISQNKIIVQQQPQIQQQYQHHQPQQQQQQHQQQHIHHHLQNNTISLHSKSMFAHQNLASAISALQQNHHMNLNLNQKNAFISVNTQDMLNVCENSSAYESSEDTGVGGLSESELIHHDVIEEIPLGDTRLLEEHDLTNVLNQIPEETFNEFLSVEQNSPFEPTQEEKEDLERALEAVDEQVKNLQQITGSNFLDDFLDDPILDDTDICEDVLVQTSGGTSEIRGGLVHT